MLIEKERCFEGVAEDWRALLLAPATLVILNEIFAFLKSEKRRKKVIYPSEQKWFNAFRMTPFEKVKVVVLGQDPYHGPGQAHGLSFSVPAGCPLPPSLRNIYKELSEDCRIPLSSVGDLTSWAQQGVLLLNSVLTVEEGMAASHQNKGWERLTDIVVSALSDDLRPKVFILWGNYAQAKGACIDATRHLVLKGVHPSPLSAHRGFFGQRPFSQANEFLKKTGQSPIEWALTMTEDIQ